MTSEEAAQLRQEWTEAGNKPCRHLVLFAEYRLESTMLTGNYVCASCGSIKKMMPRLLIRWSLLLASWLQEIGRARPDREHS